VRDKLLRKWARFSAAHPWRILIGLFLVAAVCLVSVAYLYATGKFTMDMSWSDMLPANDPMAEEFDRILKEFRSASNTIVVVQGKEKEIKNFADEIAPQIEKLTEYVEDVYYKIDKDFFARHGFMLLKEKDLEKTYDMFTDLNLIPLLESINDDFEEEYIGDEEALSTKEKEDEAVMALDGFQYWISTMDKFISNPEKADEELAEKAVDRFVYGDPYFISQDKRILLMTVKPTFNEMDVEKDVASTDSIRAILNRNLENYPDVKAGLTGSIPLQRDEMYYTQRDMTLGFILALILVTLLFILTFRMLSIPILAGINLILAIIITVGLVAIYPGRLNLMTAMFGVILIGLGIDYSIHIISLYSERREIGEDAPTAMEEALSRSGGGIITGALTTAAAFFTLTVSVTRGIKEMGVVLGMGIICAMVVTMIGLPAFLSAMERFSARFLKRSFKPKHIEFTVLGKFGKSVSRHPFSYLLIGLALTGFFFYQYKYRLKFDYNMLNIEPKGLPTVMLQDTIVDAFDLSLDYAMVTASTIEESYALAEKAKKMPSFSMVENIGDYCPPMEKQRKRLVYINKIRNLLDDNRKSLPVSSANLQNLIEQLGRLDMNIYELSQLAFLGGQDKVDKKCKTIIGDPESENPESIILNLVDKIKENPVKAIIGLNKFQKFFKPLLREKVYNMANPRFLSLDNIPYNIKSRYVNDEEDLFLVNIYPREHIWNFENMRRFSKQVELVSKKATGLPLVFLRLIDLIGRDGKRATVLTLFIVVLLLWLDFRSLKLALLGIIPLIAGGLWMLGLLSTFGMMLTVVNVIGIPMIVGIGIDDGVHILHRYRVEGFNRTSRVLMSTGKAVLLTSLTTMAGFGSLMISKYRGFIGLGALLVFGVGACFITTVLFMPSIINIAERIIKKRNSKANKNKGV
jgi:hopanoid biosynthesis associated RND transporter like protein HpnN